MGCEIQEILITRFVAAFSPISTTSFERLCPHLEDLLILADAPPIAPSLSTSQSILG